jgi:imidazolonepropionase-like amidohydrolase
MVAGSLVIEIAEGYVESREDTLPLVIDLRDNFVLPGLIDLHVHLTTPVAPGGEMRSVTQTPADLVLLALELSHRNLAAGFTTVVDLGTGRGAHEEAVFALRDAVDEGTVTGPRILAVGSPVSPSGASRTARYRDEVQQIMPPPGVCDGADDCRRVVREQVARGADIINIYISGSLNDPHLVQQTFTEEEMRAIIDTAHQLGRPVIADGHTAKGINAALEAGADIVDTAPWADNESWRVMRETDAILVPHLYAFEQAVGDEPDRLADGTLHWIPDPIKKRLYEIKSKPYSAAAAHRAGVTIAFGSDTGVIPHGANAGEFRELTEVGLSESEAIAAATSNAAKAIGMQHMIGKLDAGMAADLIAVDDNPLKNIGTLERVKFVMKDGKVVKQDK